MRDLTWHSHKKTRNLISHGSQQTTPLGEKRSGLSSGFKWIQSDSLAATIFSFMALSNSKDSSHLWHSWQALIAYRADVSWFGFSLVFLYEACTLTTCSTNPFGCVYNMLPHTKFKMTRIPSNASNPDVQFLHSWKAHFLPLIHWSVSVVNIFVMPSRHTQNGTKKKSPRTTNHLRWSRSQRYRWWYLLQSSIRWLCSIETMHVATGHLK